MKFIKLDFSRIETLNGLHEYLKQQMNLPDHYGNNLDALYDCLTGEIELPVKITFENLSVLEKKIGEKAHAVFTVFQDAANDTGKIEIFKI